MAEAEELRRDADQILERLKKGAGLSKTTAWFSLGWMARRRMAPKGEPNVYTHTEFFWFKWSIGFGIVSFVVVILLWLGVWLSVRGII
jgi:hypothetical protein